MFIYNEMCLKYLYSVMVFVRLVLCVCGLSFLVFYLLGGGVRLFVCLGGGCLV